MQGQKRRREEPRGLRSEVIKVVLSRFEKRLKYLNSKSFLFRLTIAAYGIGKFSTTVIYFDRVNKNVPKQNETTLKHCSNNKITILKEIKKLIISGNKVTK